MKLIFRILFILISVCVCCYAHAGPGENDTKITKTITKGYRLPKNGFVEVHNKYGQIVVRNSDDDSVRIKVEVIAYGKDHRSANKIMDRVDFDFNLTNQYLTIETVLDRKSGTFKEIWNSIGDYSKTLLSKNKLEINYQLSVPAGAALSINNKFGDVYIDERNNKTEIDVSHGNLRANNFNANSTIAVSYGDTRIKYLKSGELRLKSSDATIRELGNVELLSSSSKINIIRADELEIDSRSDKSIEIEEVNVVKGKMLFSRLEIEALTKSVDVQMKYSDLEIDLIPFSFSFVRISGRTSYIDLVFANNTYMEVDIIADEDDLNIPLTNLEKEYVDQKKGIIRVTGILGVKNNYKGNVNIDAESGTVSLKLLSAHQSVKSPN